MGRKPLKSPSITHWEETKVLRMLAVIALVASFLVLVGITISSGILGNGGAGSSGVESVSDSAASPASETDASEETNSPGDADAPEASPSTQRTYAVEAGDSFYTIAKKFDTSISEIQKLNPDLDPSNLTPGTKVVIP